MEYGLIGEKLGHSASPEIHGYLADYNYVLNELTEEEFTDFMENKDFKAINVTIPYKQKVIPYLYEMNEAAKAIGAVNTIVNRDGKLYGYNTDMPGFIYMVKHNGIDMKDKKVVVIGNGGASQAVQAGIKKLEAREIIVVDPFNMTEGVITYEECFEKHSDAEVLVNTSPIGMFPKVDNSPVDLKNFPNCKAVVDVIANPIPTKLVAEAKERGMKGVNGLEMLIAQAKYASEIFTDSKIDDEKISQIYDKMKP